MSIKSLGTDGWLVDVRPQGRSGKRIRKKFPTKSEAQQYERWAIATLNSKDWLDTPKDKRYLSELIDLWWKHKGQTLRSGRVTYTSLTGICKRLGNPRVDHITTAFLSEYRAKRLASGKSKATVNHERDNLSGVFTSLIEIGHYSGPHPLAKFKALRLEDKEMGYLSKFQIKAILDELSGDNLSVVKLCLATGARWTEAATLKRSQVSRDRVTYAKTKSGQSRTIPISPELHSLISKGDQSTLFPSVSYEEVRDLIKRTAPDLPEGQATHVFRHTFASHFMMNGGNILTLQKILGHSTINQTMVYAHFAPEHLIDAVKLNPTADL
ncbi:tyrosine-type recombinase/integrase [Sodalis endosymbiont of Spalangia cameroni]|uniref:phage integrase n=1 Tax=Sodalis praecaptivus TaxID=1239307 RepID=UPI0031F77F6D